MKVKTKTYMRLDTFNNISGKNIQNKKIIEKIMPSALYNALTQMNLS